MAPETRHPFGDIVEASSPATEGKSGWLWQGLQMLLETYLESEAPGNDGNFIHGILTSLTSIASIREVANSGPKSGQIEPAACKIMGRGVIMANRSTRGHCKFTVGGCREQTYGHQGGEWGAWWDELGDWD